MITITKLWTHSDTLRYSHEISYTQMEGNRQKYFGGVLDLGFRKNLGLFLCIFKLF